MTPQKQIKQLAELAKEVREHAQHQYSTGRQELAMEAVCYAEGIERAMVEIAVLNSIPMRDVEELRSFDLSECRARFAAVSLGPSATSARFGARNDNRDFGPRPHSPRSREPELR